MASKRPQLIGLECTDPNIGFSLLNENIPMIFTNIYIQMIALSIWSLKSLGRKVGRCLNRSHPRPSVDFFRKFRRNFS